MSASLTAEILRADIQYDALSGAFTRGEKIVGTVNAHGHVVVWWRGKLHYAHRLAWLYMTGEWPIADIDHKNLQRADNRWSNLRSATRAQNLANSGPRPSNTSGWKGVSRGRSGKNWRASISVGNKYRGLGAFACPVAAHLAYLLEAGKRHGEFARGR